MTGDGQGKPRQACMREHARLPGFVFAGLACGILGRVASPRAPNAV